MAVDRIVKGSNPLGQAGFFVSLIGVCGVAVVGFGEATTLAGIGVAVLTLPGIALSAIGLRHRPRRFAAWGFLIGIAGALFLPTFYLTLIRGL